jgi:transposase
MQYAPDEALLSVDFSLDSLDISLLGPAGEVLIPHHRYTNNWIGFDALRDDLIHHLHACGDVLLTAVGESTGNFWWHAFYHLATHPDLQALDPRLVLLNPAHVKAFRKALPEADKTDDYDPSLIGAYYRTHGADHEYVFDERYLPLRFLTRAYHRVAHTLAAEKAFCLSVIYLTTSDYQRRITLQDHFGATSLHILTEYPNLMAIADLPVLDLAAELNVPAHGKLQDPAALVRALHHIAHSSYPLPDTLRPTLHQVQHMTLDHIRFLEGQKAAYKALIEAALAELPEADLALAHKGLGPILVAGCLSEIQDTRRFVTGEKYDRKRKAWRPRTYRDGQAGVAKMAGLWWPKNSSGRFEGRDRRLARERNPHLRYWFVQAAYALKRHQPEYRDYYALKFRETSKNPHKRALILTARKAVRLVFALLHKGQMARLEEEAAT